MTLFTLESSTLLLLRKNTGIVLKKAKLTKKGRCATNVANGSVVETLVILAGDLVQVVAKGVPLPFDGFAGNIAHGNGEASFEVLPSVDPLNGTKKFNKSTMDKIKSNRKRNSVQNENGFADLYAQNLEKNMKFERCYRIRWETQRKLNIRK